MDLNSVVDVVTGVVAGASVLSLALTKVFPKLAKVGPVLQFVSKLLRMLALNPKPADPGPAKPAVAKALVVRDPKTGKVVSVRVRK